MVNDWPAAGILSITLQDKTAEVPPATLTGRFKKLIYTNETEDLNDDVYKIVNGNYVSDGDEAHAPDMINGAAGNDVIDGGGGDDAHLGMVEAMLRSTSKNGQKCKSAFERAHREGVANDHLVGLWRSVA